MFNNGSFFEQRMTFERITDAIAKIVSRDFLAEAVLLAFCMVKTDDSDVIHRKAFMRRKVRRCLTDSCGRIGVVF